jgi:hypothetical protein
MFFFVILLQSNNLIFSKLPGTGRWHVSPKPSHLQFEEINRLIQTKLITFSLQKRWSDGISFRKLWLLAETCLHRNSHDWTQKIFIRVGLWKTKSNSELVYKQSLLYYTTNSKLLNSSSCWISVCNLITLDLI